jgi:outer membrane protein assembly factor BamB
MQIEKCKLKIVISQFVIFSALLGLPPAAGLNASAEEPPATRDLLAETLALRTALHQDPLLEAPLEKLLSVYRQANRLDELLAMYRSHLARYPKDAGSTTVLLRLLAESDDAAAAREARAACDRFPKNAALHFIYYTLLRRHGGNALDELDRAIDLEQQPNRKLAWIEILLPIATAEDRADLAKKHLAALGELAVTPEGRLEVARKMNRFKFHAQALELLAKSPAAPPAAETMVSLELEAATAEVGLDRAAAAGARLDRLLAKLAADYWQRGEVVRRRLALLQSQSPDAREAIIRLARKQAADSPADEAAALNLSQVLSGLEMRREAVAALVEAGGRMPKSEAIERNVLELLDQLRDDFAREQYLTQRIKLQPQRKDLVFQHVKTLYLLGRRKEAQTELDAAVADLPKAEQATQMREIARYLRRSSLPGDAVALYQKIVALDPARVDVRREWAETCIAQGDRERLHEILAGIDPRKAELETVLDLVPFMLQQELYAEARILLRKRLELDRESIDLRLLLLDLERRLGNSADGGKLVEESRTMADTAARYRQWLDAAVAFHQDLDSLPGFLDAEERRLARETGDWSGRPLERRMIYFDTASRGDRRTQVSALLEKDLAGKLPLESRVKLRRQLLGVLEGGVTANPDFPKQLAELAKEDPQASDECNTRLALWYLKSQRPDQVMQLLPKISVARIKDPALLSGLKTLYAQDGRYAPQVLDILERLTIINPTERSAWEQWLSALAGTCDDTRLSLTIRTLLAGMDKMPLSPETRRLLQTHLNDSQWRQINRRLASGTEGELADTLPLLAAAERTARDDVQWLWIAWMRAYVLNRLDRREARDEAIRELDRVVARVHEESARSPGFSRNPTSVPPAGITSLVVPPSGGISALAVPPRPPEGGTTSAEPRISFPDGLSISLSRARALLTSAAPPAVPPALAQRQGPIGELKLKWAFDTTRDVPIVATLPAGGRIVVADQSRTLYGVDRETGKLVWEQANALPPLPASRDANNQPLSFALQQSFLPGLLRDDAGRFFVSGTRTVWCRAVEDGRLLWQADIGPSGSSKSPPTAGAIIVPTARIFLNAGKLLTFDIAGSTLAKLDPATGKIVWQRSPPAEPEPQAAASVPAANNPYNNGNVQFAWLSGGASLCGQKLLIYGPRTAILDVETGDVDWSFEPWRVSKFPVRLAESDDVQKTAAISVVPAVSGAFPIYGTPSGYYPRGFYAAPSPVYGTTPGTGTPVEYVDYLQPSQVGGQPGGEVCLSGPAVAWAVEAKQNPACWAVLRDGHLLLAGQTGLKTLRTDLPLSATSCGMSGMLLGIVGNTVCLLDDNGNLTLLDAASGAGRTQHAIPPINAQCDQFILDGPVLYMTGPQGIQCIKARTGEKVFSMRPWPKGALRNVASPPAAAAGAALPTPYPVATPFGYGVAPAYVNNQPDPAILRQPPTLGHAEGGVLYTVSQPGRVVALGEK